MCSRVSGVGRRGWRGAVGGYRDVDRWWLVSMRGGDRKGSR